MRVLLCLMVVMLISCWEPEVIEKQCREQALMWAMAHGIKKATVQCAHQYDQVANCDLVANGSRFYLLRCNPNKCMLY